MQAGVKILRSWSADLDLRPTGRTSFDQFVAEKLPRDNSGEIRLVAIITSNKSLNYNL